MYVNALYIEGQNEAFMQFFLCIIYILSYAVLQGHTQADLSSLLTMSWQLSGCIPTTTLVIPHPIKPYRTCSIH